MEKKVSIIMGIYNNEKTLEDSVDSIINQTYSNWELIMCDDGSKDSTYQIAKNYGKMYPDKITVLRNEENLRLAATLNKCLEYVTGEYIARMDADDICINNRLEKQVEFLDKNSKYDLVGSNLIPFDEQGDKGIREIIEFPNKYSMKVHSPFAHPTIMARKEVYERLKGYKVSNEITRCEDVEFWFRFFYEGFEGYNLQIPLLRYREQLVDFKKRKLKYSIDSVKVSYNGYRLLKYSKLDYIYLVKPIISALVPPEMMSFLHKFKDNRKKRLL